MAAAEEADLLAILEQALIENKTQVLNDILGPDYEGMLEALGSKEVGIDVPAGSRLHILAGGGGGWGRA